MGSGIYVIAPEPASTAPRVESELSPFEIIRARQLIECELAALAAGSKNTSDIVHALRDALDADGSRHRARADADPRRPAVPCAHRRGERKLRAAACGDRSLRPAQQSAVRTPRPPLRAGGHLAPGDGRAPARGRRRSRPRTRRARAPRCTSTCSARTTASAPPGPAAIRRSALQQNRRPHEVRTAVRRTNSPSGGRCEAPRGLHEPVDRQHCLHHPRRARPAPRARTHRAARRTRRRAAPRRRRHLRLRPALLQRRPRRRVHDPRAADPGHEASGVVGRDRRRGHAREAGRQGGDQSVACVRALRLLPRGPPEPVPHMRFLGSASVFPHVQGLFREAS